MATPSIGVLLVWWAKHRTTGARAWARSTGLTLGPRKGRTVALIVAGWLGVPVLVALAIAISAALGVVSLDLHSFSLFQHQLAGARKVPISTGTLVVLQIVSAVLVAPFINAIPAFGEEWGWRGWLLPRLTRFGILPGLLLSGLIWGAWHAPLTLLGYNYPALGGWAAPFFAVFCVILGALFGWLRLRSGSVWPSVIAHGSLNATAGLILLIGDAAHPPVLAIAGLTGLVGWAILAVVAFLVLKIWPVPAAVEEKSDCPAEPVATHSPGADQTRRTG
jgi:membrane protease YdiL (CAAX protease family)